MNDINRFDWEGMVQGYIKRAHPYYTAMAEGLIPGMKAVGGPGNGIFEVIQDFTSFTGLCMMQFDEPEAYEFLWKKIGDAVVTIWEWFLPRHGDSFAVCRFGDDLGYCSSTMLAPDDIRKHIIPHYKRIVDLVHSYNKPFLLHSCGKIYEVMDDLINTVGIDAKHSNEDSIDTFDVWLDRYGDRIGNFGGVEMNILCLSTPAEVKEYVTNICEMSEGKGGVAIGSGNQIASYVKPECFIAMTEAVREFRNKN
jgi:uroporphyrinogen decarboxylase